MKMRNLAVAAVLALAACSMDGTLKDPRDLTPEEACINARAIAGWANTPDATKLADSVCSYPGLPASQ